MIEICNAQNETAVKKVQEYICLMIYFSSYISPRGSTNGIKYCFLCLFKEFKMLLTL